jgi:hypothetical protein
VLDDSTADVGGVLDQRLARDLADEVLAGDLQKANELKGQLEERGREGTLNDRDFNDLVRLSLATQLTEAQNGSK